MAISILLFWFRKAISCERNKRQNARAETRCRRSQGWRNMSLGRKAYDEEGGGWSGTQYYSSSTHIIVSSQKRILPCSHDILNNIAVPCLARLGLLVRALTRTGVCEEESTIEKHDGEVSLVFELRMKEVGRLGTRHEISICLSPHCSSLAILIQ